MKIREKASVSLIARRPVDESLEWARQMADAIAREQHLFYDQDEIDFEMDDHAYTPPDGDEIFSSHEPVVGNLIDLEDLFQGLQLHNRSSAAPTSREVRPHLVVLSVYNPKQTA